MMGLDVLEHTARQLSVDEARQLYQSMAEQVLCIQYCQYLFNTHHNKTGLIYLLIYLLFYIVFS